MKLKSLAIWLFKAKEELIKKRQDDELLLLGKSNEKIAKKNNINKAIKVINELSSFIYKNEDKMVDGIYNKLVNLSKLINEIIKNENKLFKIDNKQIGEIIESINNKNKSSYKELNQDIKNSTQQDRAILFCPAGNIANHLKKMNIIYGNELFGLEKDKGIGRKFNNIPSPEHFLDGFYKNIDQLIKKIADEPTFEKRADLVDFLRFKFYQKAYEDLFDLNGNVRSDVMRYMPKDQNEHDLDYRRNMLVNYLVFLSMSYVARGNPELSKKIKIIHNGEIIDTLMSQEMCNINKYTPYGIKFINNEKNYNESLDFYIYKQKDRIPFGRYKGESINNHKARIIANFNRILHDHKCIDSKGLPIKRNVQLFIDDLIDKHGFSERSVYEMFANCQSTVLKSKLTGYFYQKGNCDDNQVDHRPWKVSHRFVQKSELEHYGKAIDKIKEFLEKNKNLKATGVNEIRDIITNFYEKTPKQDRNPYHAWLSIRNAVHSRDLNRSFVSRLTRKSLVDDFYKSIKDFDQNKNIGRLSHIADCKIFEILPQQKMEDHFEKIAVAINQNNPADLVSFLTDFDKDISKIKRFMPRKTLPNKNKTIDFDVQDAMKFIAGAYKINQPNLYKFGSLIKNGAVFNEAINAVLQDFAKCNHALGVTKMTVLNAMMKIFADITNLDMTKELKQCNDHEFDQLVNPVINQIKNRVIPEQQVNTVGLKI